MPEFFLFTERSRFAGAGRSSPTNGKGATLRSGTFAATRLCDIAPDFGLLAVTPVVALNAQQAGGSV